MVEKDEEKEVIGVEIPEFIGSRAFLKQKKRLTDIILSNKVIKASKNPSKRPSFSHKRLSLKNDSVREDNEGIQSKSQLTRDKQGFKEKLNNDNSFSKGELAKDKQKLKEKSVEKKQHRRGTEGC